MIHGLSNYIYKGLEAQEGSRSKRNWTGLSELNYCIRRLHSQKYSNYKIKTEQESLITFQMGRDIEAMVIDNLIRGAEGKLELVKFGDEDQTPVYLGSLKGHPDILLKDTETGEYILVEVKSAAQTSFNEAKAKGVKKAQPNHYTQLVAYMCALRDTYNIKVAYGIYLMVKKSGNPPTMRDAAMIYEEVVHWDSREEAKIYLKVEQIEALTKEVEPDPPYDTPNKECSMCPVSHLCPLMIGE